MLFYSKQTKDTLWFFGHRLRLKITFNGYSQLNQLFSPGSGLICLWEISPKSVSLPDQKRGLLVDQFPCLQQKSLVIVDRSEEAHINTFIQKHRLVSLKRVPLWLVMSYSLFLNQIYLAVPSDEWKCMLNVFYVSPAYWSIPQILIPDWRTTLWWRETPEHDSWGRDVISVGVKCKYFRENLRQSTTKLSI